MSEMTVQFTVGRKSGERWLLTRMDDQGQNNMWKSADESVLTKGMWVHETAFPGEVKKGDVVVLSIAIVGKVKNVVVETEVEAF